MVGLFTSSKHGVPGLNQKMLALDKLFRWRVGAAVLTCALIFVATGTASLRARAPQNKAKPAAQISPAAQDLTTGRAFSISDGVAAGFITYQSITEYPDKRRLSYGLGKSKGVTLINNGDQGWEIDQYGTIEQPQKRISAWEIANRYGLENVLRVLAHEPGVLVLPGGQDFVDNFPASILDIIDSRQVDVKLYLNLQNYLPLRIAYRVRNPQTQDWDDYVDVYSDYHLIDGIQTPMHLVRYLNGERVAETFRTSAKYNQNYPPTLFELAE
jgi:hypothetical protein